ncbi:unnamed protein product, partial [marine sediment metagenome]
ADTNAALGDFVKYGVTVPHVYGEPTFVKMVPFSTGHVTALSRSLSSGDSSGILTITSDLSGLIPASGTMMVGGESMTYDSVSANGVNIIARTVETPSRHPAGDTVVFIADEFTYLIAQADAPMPDLDIVFMPNPVTGQLSLMANVQRAAPTVTIPADSQSLTFSGVSLISSYTEAIIDASIAQAEYGEATTVVDQITPFFNDDAATQIDDSGSSDDGDWTFTSAGQDPQWAGRQEGSKRRVEKILTLGDLGSVPDGRFIANWRFKCTATLVGSSAGINSFIVQANLDVNQVGPDSGNNINFHEQIVFPAAWFTVSPLTSFDGLNIGSTDGYTVNDFVGAKLTLRCVDLDPTDSGGEVKFQAFFEYDYFDTSTIQQLTKKAEIDAQSGAASGVMYYNAKGPSGDNLGIYEDPGYGTFRESEVTVATPIDMTARSVITAWYRGIEFEEDGDTGSTSDLIIWINPPSGSLDLSSSEAEPVWAELNAENFTNGTLRVYVSDEIIASGTPTQYVRFDLAAFDGYFRGSLGVSVATVGTPDLSNVQ